MNKINNKGFTLVELLAIVAILGILATIAVPTISAIMNKSKEDNKEAFENSVKLAAKMYVSDNKYKMQLSNENDITITLETLIKAGYLNDGKPTIKDPTDRSKNIDIEKSSITVTYDFENKKFEYSNITIIK